MADLSHSAPTSPQNPHRWLGYLRSAWGASVVLLILLAMFDAPQIGPTVIFTANAPLYTAPFILFAMLAGVAWQAVA